MWFNLFNTVKICIFYRVFLKENLVFLNPKNSSFVKYWNRIVYEHNTRKENINFFTWKLFLSLDLFLKLRIIDEKKTKVYDLIFSFYRKTKLMSDLCISYQTKQFLPSTSQINGKKIVYIKIFSKFLIWPPKKNL